MTKEDIIRMAKWSGWNAQEVDCFFYEIESFATHVAEYERELCAKVCDERAQTKSLSNHRRCDADLLASAIRSRDQP